MAQAEEDGERQEWEGGGERAGGQNGACLQKAQDAQTHTRRQQALSALQPVMCTPSVSFYLSLDSAKLHYLATNKKKRREYTIYPPAAAGSSQCGMASTATKPTRQPTTTPPPQGQRPNIFPRRGRESLSSLASPPSAEQKNSMPSWCAPPTTCICTKKKRHY
jgi:hypothetical protein